MDQPLMMCGHKANARAYSKDDVRHERVGKPACAICSCEDVANEMPNLTGRKMQCSLCKKISPSSFYKPFFKFQGEGSEAALTKCKTCNRVKAQHDKIQTFPTMIKLYGVHEFEPHGPFEYDSFYDGCRGWN